MPEMYEVDAGSLMRGLDGSVIPIAEYGYAKPLPNGKFLVDSNAVFATMDGGSVAAPDYGYATPTGQEGRYSAPTAPAEVPKPGQDNQSRALAANAALLLRQYGLDGLIPIVDGWIRGGMSWEEAQIQLYDDNTDAGKVFDQRFPAIKIRRIAGKASISPAEYLAYERTATDYLRSAGLPQGFYDTKSDFTQLLANDVSLNELNQRVNNGFAAVAKAPAQVREAFGQYFGANGDAALASYFLDGEKALPMLTQAVATAEVGGAGLQFGFGLGEQRASQIAKTGVDFKQATAGFDTISQLGSVFDETMGEAGGTDLTSTGEGVDAIFNLDGGQAKKKVQKRLEDRSAFDKQAGGAASGERGVFGLGSAKS